MKKAVIYARHITYRSYEPSITEQLYNCNQCADKYNLEVVKTYCETSNVKLKVYPMFEKMKKDCKKLKVDTIIIYSMFIVGRIYTRVRKFTDEMKKKGIKVIFVDIDASPFRQQYEMLEKLINKLTKGGDK